MHTPSERDDSAFRAEFERILREAEAGNRDADFTGFVFPIAHYMHREFKVACIFSEATFVHTADFSMSIFKRGADFSHAKFSGRVHFHQSVFEGVTRFNGAEFRGHTLFDAAEFNGESEFTGASFVQKVQFIGSGFLRDLDCTGTRFRGGADFDKATFRGTAHFGLAEFGKGGDFSRARFEKDVSFRQASFNEGAGFWDTKFNSYVDFAGAVFKGNAAFPSASFEGLADFARASFLGSAEFTGTRFRRDKAQIPGPAFYMAEFAKPEAVIFRKTYLGQALFHNCNVAKINFSSVEWRARPGTRKQMVFEEEVDVDHETASSLKPKNGERNERDYGLIAVLYQQLKKNYDGHMDYSMGDEFHYGEMEMKRLNSRAKNSFARWLRKNLGLVAMYKYASEYGNSYLRPVLALVAVSLAFTLLFPLAGLDRSENSKQSVPVSGSLLTGTPQAGSELSYQQIRGFVRARGGQKWVGVAAFFGNSLMTTISVAGFQKELKYEPSYPWGRALALLELLLTSTLVALFLLALRRQFRR